MTAPTITHTKDQLFALIGDERRRLAGQLRELTPQQFAADSLCAGWRVLDVAAHLTTPFAVSRLRLFGTIARHRGDIDTAFFGLARRIAERGADEIVRLLHDEADHRFTPPGFGPEIPLSDVVIHSLDILVPLGLESTTPVSTFAPVLDVVADATPKMPFPLDDASGLRFRATDQDWSRGEGLEVVGSSPSLALALSGRRAGFDGLEGAGVDELRARTFGA